MPFDVVKTQQQITLGKVLNSNSSTAYNQSKTILHHMRSIVKSNGASSLFAGFLFI